MPGSNETQLLLWCDIKAPAATARILSLELFELGSETPRPVDALVLPEEADFPVSSAKIEKFFLSLQGNRRSQVSQSRFVFAIPGMAEDRCLSWQGAINRPGILVTALLSHFDCTEPCRNTNAPSNCPKAYRPLKRWQDSLISSISVFANCRAVRCAHSRQYFAAWVRSIPAG